MVHNSKRRLRNLSRKFVTHVLGNEKAKGNCFAICYTLSIYLKSKKIDNLIKSGLVNGEHHYIISLQRDNKIIVDPTIKQFNQWKPLVYIGQKPNNYANFVKADVEEVVEKYWKEPLLNCGRRQNHLNPNGYDQVADIKSLLKIHIRAASIFQYKKKLLTCTNYYEMYRNIVYEMVLKYESKKIELVDKLLLGKYNSLLNEAKKHNAQH